MDPLSITTGCVALITAVGSCARAITNFVVRCREARQDLAVMTHELSDLDITLHMLKDDAESKKPSQLPADLRQRLSDIIENCNSVLVELQALLSRYDGAGLDRAARWALLGRKDAEKIRASLKAHKEALSLLVEATTLHITTVVATDTRKVSQDTALIKAYTMKIVEQLAKQDEILEQIAWIRAVVTPRAAADDEKTLVMDKYLASMTDYAASVCGDSVTNEVAEEMHQLSLDSPISNGVSSHNLLLPFEPSPFPPDDAPEPITIVMGNTHRIVALPSAHTSNKHLWSFYLQSSGEAIIHEVRISLHPTFVPPELLFRGSPCRVTRIGWGYFTIGITIVLKPGYLWYQERSRILKLKWQLDFDGFGSSASYQYAVVVERGNALR